MDKSQLRKLINEYLEAADSECRWCFAIDKVRVTGQIVAKHDSSDALLLLLSCPRCGGTFTHYCEIFERRYLEERIYKLHPEIQGQLGEERFQEILDLVFPELSSIWKDPE